MAQILRINPDKEKAKSILKMVDTTLDMVKTIDVKKFPSNLLKEYYDILRELIGIILLMDGYKIIGEESHKELIEYIGKNYSQLSRYQITLLDDLRIKRNKISYNGFFIEPEYLERKIKDIFDVIKILKKIINEKIG